MAKLEFGFKECAKCEYNLRCHECIYNKTDISRLVAETKADTVRKMQERLKECFDNGSENMSIYTESYVLFVIDQIAKEMLEGEK